MRVMQSSETRQLSDLWDDLNSILSELLFYLLHTRPAAAAAAAAGSHAW